MARLQQLERGSERGAATPIRGRKPSDEITLERAS
jgi:hypothetical protein